MEVFPNANNYRTYKVNKIELSPVVNADVGPAPTASTVETAPVEGTSSLNIDSSIAQGADFVKPRDDGPGINPFYFSDLSRSLAAMLQQGNTKTVTDKLDGVWGELSARQREKIRALLNRYGVKYKM